MKMLLFSYRDHPNYVGATYHGMACDPKFAAGLALVCPFSSVIISFYSFLFSNYIMF